MKTNKFYAALVMGLAVVACAQNAEPAAEGEAAEAVKEKTMKDYLPSKALKDSVSYLVGVNFGSFIKGNNFGDLNYAQIKKGMEDFIKSEGTPRDENFGEQFKIDPQMINELFNKYLEDRYNYKLLENKEKEQNFLAANAKKEGVQTTESGLQYKIIEPGNDVKPGTRDTVWVKYCGKLIDGTVFDETPEDADPIHFTLNRVVKGWGEGLQLIGEGGKIQLFIPAELGYGEQGTQGIEPNSTLIFDVELTKVGPFVEAPEAE